MHDRLDAASRVVTELAEHADELRAVFDRVSGLSGVTIQQIHADLHLGQTLRTVKGWKIVDFEGEPARPLAERVLPDSPWRDVAGMLRSFDYAPRVVERTYGDAEPAARRPARVPAPRSGPSATGPRSSTAYAGRELTADEETLLAAYVADKAVYEAVYEARNRPDLGVDPARGHRRGGGRMSAAKTHTRSRSRSRSSSSWSAASTATPTPSSAPIRTVTTSRCGC